MSCDRTVILENRVGKLTYIGIIYWAMSAMNLAFSRGALSDRIPETAQRFLDLSSMFFWIGIVAVIAGQEFRHIERLVSGTGDSSSSTDRYVRMAGAIVLGLTLAFLLLEVMFAPR